MQRLFGVNQYVNLAADVNKDSIKVVSLLQWALLEDAGLYVMQKLSEETNNWFVLEHYNNFFKFRIEKGDRSLGFFFGFMEKLKSDINFDEYAVSQTTLEQIFNAFALEQDMDAEDTGIKKRRSTIREDKEE